MKNKFKYLILSLLSISMFESCSFLEVEDYGKSDTNTFFAELDGLRTAREGLYNVTYDLCEYLYQYAELAGDCVQASSVINESEGSYYQYNFMTDVTASMEVTVAGYIWKKGNVVLSNVNTLLSYIGSLKESYPNDTKEIDRIAAEARYLRAFAHFALVSCYAQPYNYTDDASHIGVPVVDRIISPKETITRSSVARVYELILRDLNDARSILGDAAPSDAHYVSGMACNALLARIYLHMGNYTEAEACANRVIGSIQLTPADKYAAMFTNQELGSEAIFRLTGAYSSKRLRNFYDYMSPEFTPATDFMKTFRNADDVRLTLMKAPDGQTACMKYYDMTNVAVEDQFYHITISRASEMYLVRAEALCMQNNLKDAAADIATLRARALNVTVAEAAFNYNNSQPELLRLIKEEYQKELCFEGHRFFDLARWNDDIVRSEDTNSIVKRLAYPDYRFALPIPRGEIDANPDMEQNEGYK